MTPSRNSHDAAAGPGRRPESQPARTAWRGASVGRSNESLTQ